MQELKATQAREIDKASVTEATPVVVDGMAGVYDAPPAMQAGDFYFRTAIVPTWTSLPTGFFKRLLWSLRGKPRELTNHVLSTIVMSCPFCGMAILSDLNHHITSKLPLTITEPIACPYSSHDITKAHSFRITEGNITAA